MEIERLQTSCRRRLWPLMVVLMVFMTVRLQGQSPANVLLVINDPNPLSSNVGSYYAAARHVPHDNIVRLNLKSGDTISRADYERLIEKPLAEWLTRNQAQDRILYIVLTKGIPLRVAGTEGVAGSIASVDSELALLYRKMSGGTVQAPGKIANPFFLSGDATRPPRFTHEDYDIFLVTRLDGYTVNDVRSLIDRASSPTRAGTIVLDDRGGLHALNPWLKGAAEIVRSMKGGNPVIYDASGTVIRNVVNVLGYYSWGSNDSAIRDRHLNIGFMKGALAAMFVSSDGRTFDEPPSTWKIGSWDDKKTFFADSPQSLAGDLIRDGVTGVAGHVAEPYLDATIRPNTLFPAYLSGANLAEAFYLAMPYLSWQTVVVGDPLCAPFRSQPLRSDDIHKGVDPGSGLPRLFLAWRQRNRSR